MNMSPGWRRFFIRTGSALAPVLTVAAALVLLADLVGALIFVAGVLVAIGWGIQPHLREAWGKVQRYEALESEHEKLKAQVAGLLAEQELLKASAEEGLAGGIEEGKLQVLGSLMGSIAGPPQLIAVSVTGATLELVAQFDDPAKPVPLGARFQLQMTATGDRKGVVQVVRLDEPQRMVYLQAVERTVPEYWERLEDEAVANPTAPQGVRLAPVQYDPPRALMPPATTTRQRLFRSLLDARRQP